jgi:hypothetical protein
MRASIVTTKHIFKITGLIFMALLTWDSEAQAEVIGVAHLKVINYTEDKIYVTSDQQCSGTGMGKGTISDNIGPTYYELSSNGNPDSYVKGELLVDTGGGCANSDTYVDVYFYNHVPSSVIADYIAHYKYYERHQQNIYDDVVYPPEGSSGYYLSISFPECSSSPVNGKECSGFVSINKN